jgi:prepilin signal peptidase PulO-like enzyme (type II secretory pathway)
MLINGFNEPLSYAIPTLICAATMGFCALASFAVALSAIKYRGHEDWTYFGGGLMLGVAFSFFTYVMFICI